MTDHRVRSALRGLSTVLIVAGVLLLADAVTTLVWQEPISAFIAQQDQDRLAGDLDDLEKAPPSGLEQRALSVLKDPSQRVAFLARAQRRRARHGQAIGRIRIPSIGASFVVVYGTDTADLEKGPGLYPRTSFPGIPGTTAIAGHRTTYLAPFRNIDDLGRDDEIVLDMPYARLTYRVEKHLIVDPTDVWVTRKVDHDRLVLSACHPLYSAAKRIIVFARLVATEPRGAAARGGGRTLVEKPPGLLDDAG
jgi:sortase A